MFGNMSYILTEKSIFHSVRINNSVFESLHLESKLKEVRIKEKQEVQKMEERFRIMREESQVPEVSNGSKIIIGPRRIMSFYEYNREWQQSVMQKVENVRQVNHVEEQVRQPTNRVDISNHKGPVSNWNQNFMKYMKSRTGYAVQDESCSFHPAIDKQSQIIARRNGITVQKVQDRLLRYAQIKKTNKQKEVQEKPKKHAAAITPQLFDRLYYDAQKMNKKKLELQEQTPSFQPAINQKTLYDQRVQRTRKPLYFVKTEPTEKENNTPKKQLTQEDFNRFMERNEILLRKKQDLLAQKNANTEETEQICTFKPILNKNSVKMVTMLRSEANRKEKIKMRMTNSNVMIEDQNGTLSLSPANREVKMPKIKIRNIGSIEAEYLQTEDSMPIRTLQSEIMTNRMSARQKTQRTDRVYKEESKDDQNMFTDEFNLIEQQLEEMLKQVE